MVVRTPARAFNGRLTVRTTIAALLLSAICADTAAADSMFLGGASRGANSDYAFAAAVIPVLDGVLGTGPAVRLSGDYLDYFYTGGVGPVTATGWGGGLAGVYQFSGEWGWTSLSTGITFRDTHLSRFDPGNTERGSRTYFNLQADGAYNIDQDWRARGFANVTPQINGYIVQAGFDRAVWDTLRMGVNTTLQGDRNYHQMSGGVTAFLQLGPGFELDPSVGISHGGKQTSVYGSLTLVLVAG